MASSPAKALTFANLDGDWSVTNRRKPIISLRIGEYESGTACESKD